MKSRKTTDGDLVRVLEQRNKDGRYDSLIAQAKNKDFHDYKSTADVINPKVWLIELLSAFPELSDVRLDVIQDKYAEEMDEDDKKAMRKWVPRDMWPDLKL